MLQRLRSQDDHGFTLVEVAIIVVIVGLLAGIAIPVFLSQQKKAQTASISSDLRNAATSMEAYYASLQTYGDASDVLASGESPNLSRGTTIVIVQRSGSSFCLAGLRNVTDVPATPAALEANAMRWYDSASGGLQAGGATGCPVTDGYASGWQADVFTGPPTS